MFAETRRSARHQFDSEFYIGWLWGFESFATLSSCGTTVLSSFGIGSHPPVQNDRNSRNKLVQEVEVADIPCQYAGTDTPRLKIDERIIEMFPLMTRTLRRTAERKELARKHSRFAPRRRIRSVQAMRRNVFDHTP